MNKLNDLNPKSVFHFFEEICCIPHGSGNTKQISDYLVSFAVQHGLRYEQDGLNNVIIYQDGTCGMEDHEPVILQGQLRKRILHVTWLKYYIQTMSTKREKNFV